MRLAGEGSGSPEQPVPVTEALEPGAQIHSDTQLQPEAPDRLLTAPKACEGLRVQR